MFLIFRTVTISLPTFFGAALNELDVGLAFHHLDELGWRAGAGAAYGSGLRRWGLAPALV